jgi:general stress protein 26
MIYWKKKERYKNMEITLKAAEMLTKCSEISLASISENGYPRICVLSKIKSEGIKKFWVATGVSSVKVRHFSENSKAGACFYSDGNSVTMVGKVSVIHDRAVKAEMWLDWFINHFPGGIDDPDYCILEFETEEATLWIDNEFITLRGEQI